MNSSAGLYLDRQPMFNRTSQFKVVRRFKECFKAQMLTGSCYADVKQVDFRRQTSATLWSFGATFVCGLMGYFAGVSFRKK